MKKYMLLGLAITIIMGVSSAFASGNELAYKRVRELVELSTGSVASGDVVPILDSSTGKVKKIDATNLPWDGTFDGAIGGTTPAAGAFTTLDASGATTLTTAALTGTLTGDGGDALSGFKVLQVASTTTTITAAQGGSHFISNSADVMTLPEASTVLGCRYTFTCGTADDFDINPADGTDTIASISTTNGTTAVVTLAPSAGDAIRCTDIGGSITLEAIGADLWAQVAGGNGIWSDVN